MPRRGILVDVAGSTGRIALNGLYGLIGSSGENLPMNDIDPGPSYPMPYEQFVAGAMADDQSLIDTGFEVGLEAARIVEAAHRSWKEKRWVDVER